MDDAVPKIIDKIVSMAAAVDFWIQFEGTQ